MARPRSPKGRAVETAARLALAYPGTAQDLCELHHDNAFELLVATILSAQSTDEAVNKVTPTLFARYPTPAALAAADPDELEVVIHSTGFFRTKARNLRAMAAALVERFDARVPTDLDDLVTLAGVGRKTGNVVRSVALGQPGLPVDTHVLRLSKRLGLTESSDPVKVEAELDAMLEPSGRGLFSLRMILHGRRVCAARRPRCEECVLNDYCPAAFLLQP